MLDTVKRPGNGCGRDAAYQLTEILIFVEPVSRGRFCARLADGGLLSRVIPPALCRCRPSAYRPRL